MKKIRSDYQLRDEGDTDTFFLSLEEARAAITDKYSFLQDRYERSKQARKRTA